jgi:hypothetical protein
VVSVRTVQVALRDTAFDDQLLHARVFRTRKLVLCFGVLDRGCGKISRGLRRLNCGTCLRFAARIEKAGVARFDLRENGFVRRHRIADVPVDALHATGDRRRQRVDIMHSCLTFLVQGDDQWARLDIDEIDHDGPRHEAYRQGDHNHACDHCPDYDSFEVRSHYLLPGLEDLDEIEMIDTMSHDQCRYQCRRKRDDD